MGCATTQQRRADTRGASLVECLVIVAMVGIIALGGFRAFGGALRATAEEQGRCVAELDPSCGVGRRGDAVGGDAAPTRAQTISAAASSAPPASSGSASPGVAAQVGRVLAALSPVSIASAAEPPPDPSPRPREDLQADGTRIADNIVAELRRTFPYGEIGQRYSPLWPRSWVQTPDMWGDSWGNQLPGALIQSPPASHWGQPSSALGQTHSDFLYDEVRNTILGARDRVAFSTLAAPNGRYVDTIRDALTELHRRQPPDGPGVDVRILVGEVGDLRDILGSLTEGLPPDSPVRVSVGTYGGRPLSWNHAKMIVADGQDALVGGHNWWQGDYNMDNPVHDVSVRVRGPAARHAEAVFDQLWAYTVSSGTVAQTGRPPAAPRGVPPIQSGRPGDGVRVVSVGAPGGAFGNIGTYAPADTAILTMIRSAQRSVRLSQQELVSQQLAAPIAAQIGMGATGRLAAELLVPQHFSAPLLDELSLALMRGVTVDVVLTGIGPVSAQDGYSHGWTTEQTRRAILAHAVANRTRLLNLLPRADRPSRAVLDQRLQTNLDIRELRFSDEETIGGEPLRNHAKVVIVDDAAAYIGSQNLYPGGMAGRPPMTQLGEFGYIIVGSEVPRLVLGDYWNRMWPLSRARTRRP